MTSERTAVYHIFGDAGLLLYIGISKNFGHRWQQHAQVQPWWDEHRRMTVDWYDSRAEAKAVETIAIKTEGPKYNVIHAGRSKQTKLRPGHQVNELSEFRPRVIPRMLQVRPYAEHLLQVQSMTAHDIGIQRLKRTSAAYEQRREATLWKSGTLKRFALLEASLRPPLMPRHPQCCQLDWLMAVFGSSHIEIGIIPSGTELQIPLSDHGFLIIDGLTIVEAYDGSEVNAAGETTTTYRQVFDQLMATAVTGDEAQRLIIDAAKHLARRLADLRVLGEGA